MISIKYGRSLYNVWSVHSESLWVVMATNAKRLVGGLLLFAMCLSACVTNPVTGSREIVFMTQTREVELGRSAHDDITQQMGVYDDEELQQYVVEIGRELADVSHRPDLPWTFTIIDSPVVNAFALPGGFIYVTRGLMTHLGDESELAGVLGHEVGHVTARHSVQAYTQATSAQMGLMLGQIFVPAMRSPYGAPGLGDVAAQGLGLLFLKFGRDDEKQADRLGAEYAAHSGWNPNGVGGMLTTLSRIADTTDRRGTPNWLSTHPDPADRVLDVTGTVDGLLADVVDESELRVRRDQFLDRIDGMYYGDNPEQGITIGQEFLHPVLMFAFTFPDGWEIQNNPEMVVANESGQDHYMVLRASSGSGRSLDQVADKEMTDAGFHRDQGQDTEINGLDAYLGLYSRTQQATQTMIAQVAHIRHDRTVYMLGVFANADRYQSIERVVSGSLRSFRPLTQAEADKIKPNRVSIYTVRAGDTWEQLAQERDMVVEAQMLAIMNGYTVDEQPLPGVRIKTVVAG